MSNCGFSCGLRHMGGVREPAYLSLYIFGASSPPIPLRAGHRQQTPFNMMLPPERRQIYRRYVHRGHYLGNVVALVAIILSLLRVEVHATYTMQMAVTTRRAPLSSYAGSRWQWKP
ncbi:hypothetical protein HYPSUDRAFT_408083 [Hypholoma sublateritium FD-334 SS-4]|uniref:Uncharacterized protein n=1 Tax=Hypholoma sublateritium (strain FD-334 SS-4) TaxID=945553 RepID=A0A0D2P3Y3_HYPSF|nr:hypothetical protein HYPSUDRAFT_408083 [Hypholoma sublateritium FD-334 SS-4]